MTRLRFPLSIILFVSIATITLLLGTSFTAQACPLESSGLSLANNFPQRNTFTNSSNGVLGASKRESPLDAWEVAGFGAVAGLFAIAIFYRARHIRSVAYHESDLMNKHPHLEHPELTLTVVPQEALSSTFDPDILVAR